MRITVIGGTGHVGGYLVPDLVGAGHDVTVVSRGLTPPYRTDPAWEAVRTVTADRDAEDAAGTFGHRVLDQTPDAVVDMVCFTEPSARHLAAALAGRVRQLVHIGTIWVHGTLTEVPATEDAPRRPWGAYGEQKAAIERFLLAGVSDLDVAVVHPGHISGPGWPVVNPQGNRDVAVWRRLALGEPVPLPNFGLETLHHVHAADVAQLIRRCLDAPDVAGGQAFHAVSPRAVTLRGFAEAAAGWFGRGPNLELLPFDRFREAIGAEAADVSYEHVARSHSMSIDKPRRLLGYEPAHTSLAAAAESVTWLHETGQLGDGVPAPRYEEVTR